LQYSGADTRRACELHTINLWQSLADADGHGHSDAHPDSYANCDSNGDAYTDSYAYRHCNSYTYTDTYAYGYGYDPAERKPDATATSDTAASPVNGSGKLIVHSAAGIDRSRLRVFDKIHTCNHRVWIGAQPHANTPAVADSLRDDPVPVADVFAAPTPNECRFAWRTFPLRQAQLGLQKTEDFCSRSHDRALYTLRRSPDVSGSAKRVSNKMQKIALTYFRGFR
jgi:hypothetical protein